MVDTSKTYTLRIGSEQECYITPTGLSPEQLVSGLFTQKDVRLIGLGDNEHTSIAVRKQANDIFASLPNNVHHAFIERYKTDQEMVEGFLAGDPKQTAALQEDVHHPRDYYAPREGNPLRETYYEERMRSFTTFKDKKMAAHCIDDLNPLLSDGATVCHNNQILIGRDYCAVAAFSKGGKLADPNTMTDEEFDRIKKTLPERIEAGGYAVSEERRKLLLSMSKAEAASFISNYVENIVDLPKKPAGEHTSSEVKKAAQDRLAHWEGEEKKARNARDAARDEQMSANIMTHLSSPDQAGILLVGAGHLETKAPDRTDKSLEERLQDALGKAYVHIDIVPVRPEIIARYGQVVIGGQKEADYTIFVPVSDQEYQNGQGVIITSPSSNPPVNAAEGPHQHIIPPTVPKAPKQGAMLAPESCSETQLSYLPSPLQRPLSSTKLPCLPADRGSTLS